MIFCLIFFLFLSSFFSMALQRSSASMRNDRINAAHSNSARFGCSESRYKTVQNFVSFLIYCCLFVFFPFLSLCSTLFQFLELQINLNLSVRIARCRCKIESDIVLCFFCITSLVDLFVSLQSHCVKNSLLESFVLQRNVRRQIR